MRNWKYGILLTAAILIGCSGTQNRSTEVTDIPPQHLPWPASLEACSFNFEFVSEEGKVFAKIPYQDWITKGKCEEKLYTYIANLTALTCSYRVALNEYRCQLFNEENK